MIGKNTYKTSNDWKNSRNYFQALETFFWGVGVTSQNFFLPRMGADKRGLVTPEERRRMKYSKAALGAFAIREYRIQPICRTAPLAAQKDVALYVWLVLADALCGAGRARERELAEKIVRERLEYHAPR
ncbi:MAG: hypothetical protein EOM20_07610 [Spartobacteria bacterium]|nr:hypothetical protein [Spartobacteria bacterium]